MKKLCILTLFTLLLSFSFAANNSTYRIQVLNNSSDPYLITLSNPHQDNGRGTAWIHYSSINGEWDFPVELPDGNDNFDGTQDASFIIKPGERADVCAHALYSHNGITGNLGNPGCIAVSMHNQTTDASYLYESNNGDVDENGHDGTTFYGINCATQYKDFLAFQESDSSDLLISGGQSLIQLNITK